MLKASGWKKEADVRGGVGINLAALVKLQLLNVISKGGVKT